MFSPKVAHSSQNLDTIKHISSKLSNDKPMNLDFKEPKNKQ